MDKAKRARNETLSSRRYVSHHHHHSEGGAGGDGGEGGEGGGGGGEVIEMAVVQCPMQNDV
jgi:hypothetical protein